MSNLDKAIRADLSERARDVAPDAADRSMVTYAGAIRAVLDLHTHSDANMAGLRQCAACGLVSRGSWCDTVTVIADDLGVSGEDRSEPTPAPGDRVRLWFADGSAIVGRLYLDPEDDDRERVEDKDGNGWLVEVNGVRRRIEVLSEAVFPEGTS